MSRMTALIVLSLIAAYFILGTLFTFLFIIYETRRLSPKHNIDRYDIPPPLFIIIFWPLFIIVFAFFTICDALKPLFTRFNTFFSNRAVNAARKTKTPIMNNRKESSNAPSTSP